MSLFSACAGTLTIPSIVIVAATKAPAIKHAELRNPQRIESALGAPNARLQICRPPHMNSMLVAHACHKK
jgi:hypothetical protein